MPSTPKLYKIGKEIIEARNMGEALGIRRALQAEGKVAEGAMIVEHGPKDAKLGKVEVIPEKGTEKPIMGKAAAVGAPAISGSPMDALRDVGQAWQSNVVEPIAGALKDTLTPDISVSKDTYPTASPVSDFILESAADPLNYVPGPTGAILGAGEAVAGFAEGGEVVIPDDEVTIETPQLSQQGIIPAVAAPQGIDQGISDADVTLDEDKYGTTGEMAKTFAEGAAHGLVGPLATLGEKHIFGAKEEDMLGRMRENPITFGAGQAATLAAGAMTGTGAGGLMAKAGQAAVEAAGLGAAKTVGARIGSEAVRQAAEMAILSTADEATKMILNDPDTSAQSAIGHIGLGAALGGLGGAVIGSVNPLWNATLGKQVDEALTGLSSRLNGKSPLVMNENTEAALGKLGVEVAPEIRAAISGDAKATELYGKVREAQNQQLAQGVEKLHVDTAEAVASRLGIDPADIQAYSNAEAGHDLLDSFKKEYKAKYEPIETMFNKRNAEAATIALPDESRIDFYGKLIEKAVEEVGTDSPQYGLFSKWADRVLAKDTVGGVDKLRTEIGHDIEKAMRSADYNEANALKSIRAQMGELQEQQITRQAMELGETAGKLGEQMLVEREAANKAYRDFAKLSSELSDNLGIGNKFSGAKALENKLANNITAEQLLNKFSIKNNADFIPFLEQYFPATLERVKAHELKELLKPAVMKAKGDIPIDVKKLSDIVDKGMAGKREYVEALLSPEALDAIQAGRTILDSVPNPKSSGTAGWMTKMYDKMPASALAAVAMITGNNPVVGGLAGMLASKLGVDAPNAIRMAQLKFLGSNQPVNAPGFKAMVDFINASMKGETMMAKGAKAVFKAGSQVLTDSAIPSESDNRKLDKTITRMQAEPNSAFALAQGQVGHYMPQHQEAIAASAIKAAQYLQALKPQPHKIGPLDKEIPPQPSEVARYNRALSIANQPLVVLKRIKDGTLMTSDMQDLQNLYPGLYQQMAQRLSNEMTNASSRGDVIPYKTRISASLFLGTPVDSTLTPEAIMAAQPIPQAPQGPGMKPKSGGATSKLGKTTSMYLTGTQQAEQHRASRK